MSARHNFGQVYTSLRLGSRGAKALAVGIFLYALPGHGQRIAEPQYHLTGSDYGQEAPAINQMFMNLNLEIPNLRTLIPNDLMIRNNVWTGTNQFVLRVDLSSGIRFNDGTVQTSSAPAAFVYVDSFTAVTDGSTAQTSGVVCFSTVTLTLRNEAFFVYLAGSGRHDTNGGVLNVSVLVDGAFPVNTYLTNSVPIIQMRSASSGEDVNISFPRYLPAQGAGSTTVCLVIWTQTGNASWSSSDLTFGVRQ